MKYKVLLIGGSLSYPNGMASSSRALEIAKGFQSNNCEVQILSSQKEGIPLFNGINIIYGDYEYIIEKINPNIIFCLSNKVSRQKELISLVSNKNIELIYDLVEDPLGKYLNEPFFTFYPKVIASKVIGIFELYELYFKILKKYNKIAVISDNLQKMLISLGINKNNIIKIPIIKKIDDDLLVDKNEVIKYQLSYCGSISFGKDGIYNLLKAIYILKKSYPEINLNIFGKGRRIETIAVKVLLKIFKIETNVKIRGFVEKDVLLNALSSSHALVLIKKETRMNKYNFPTKIIDYISASRPMVLPNVGGISDYFKDEENAYLFSPNNVAEFVEKIDLIFKEKVDVESVVKNASILMKNKFDSKNVIYQEVLVEK